MRRVGSTTHIAQHGRRSVGVHADEFAAGNAVAFAGPSNTPTVCAVRVRAELNYTLARPQVAFGDAVLL
jgi:hypothetical protein